MDFDEDGWQQDVSVLGDVCKAFEVPVAIERSRSGLGAHAWYFFTDPLAASLARRFGFALLTHAMNKRHQIKFKSYDRFFPNDYVDIHVGALEKMYRKRLAGYAAIGYRAKAESVPDAPADIIFDNTSFLPVYQNDVMIAARETVIVSPFVTKRRAFQMLPNIETALGNKVSVVVVTRPTNAYREKDRPLVEETFAALQGAGVRLLFKTNIHQKFAVIDRKIVWYGSINLLSYGSAQESIMRLESPNIAQELLKDLGKSNGI
jgi:phosphatidylserine/phosphatidylglycerophosphate/cardiolipin synthase-like enzyme